MIIRIKNIAYSYIFCGLLLICLLPAASCYADDFPETQAADTYFTDGQYDQAILFYQKVISKAGNHRPELTAYSLFQQARAFTAIGDTQTAKLLCKKIIHTFPSTAYSQQAKAFLAQL